MIHVSTPSHMTLVTYKKEKCTWKRRMTNGKNFARVIVTKAGFVLQKGVLNSEDVEEEAEEEDYTAAGHYSASFRPRRPYYTANTSRTCRPPSTAAPIPSSPSPPRSTPSATTLSPRSPQKHAMP